MYKGLDSTLAKITPKYAPKTVQFKKLKGAPYDRVTLNDKGNFYSSIRAVSYIERKKLTVEAFDVKVKKIYKKYGKQVVGFNPNYDKKYWKIETCNRLRFTGFKTLKGLT